MNDDENTHLEEEETIADIFDIRVVAFNACIYNADGRSAPMEISSSLQKAKPYLRTQICYPKHFTGARKNTRERKPKKQRSQPNTSYLKIKRQTKTTTKEKHVCHHRGRSRDDDDDDDD